MKTLDEVSYLFEGVKHYRAKNYFMCKCPVHDDSHASLQVKLKNDGRIDLKCMCGCDKRDIRASVGLEMSDIDPNYVSDDGWQKKMLRDKSYEFGDTAIIKDSYDYHDEDGRYLFTKIRFEGGNIRGKTFRCAVVDKRNNSYSWNIPENADRFFYDHSRVINAVRSGLPIYYVEGEKDARTLKKHGMIATTLGSASDWNRTHAMYLRGAKVTILNDNDPAGRNLARRMKDDLSFFADSVRVIQVSELEKGDVTDYLEKEKHTIEELKTLIDSTEWERASWWYKSGKDWRLNEDILANAITINYPFLLVRRQDVEKDEIRIYKDGVYTKATLADLKGVIKSYLPIGTARANQLANVQNLIIADERRVIAPERLNADENIINLKNGIYHVDTGRFTAHDTRILSTVQLNANYNPDAKCPTFMKYMKDLCSDDLGNVDYSKMAVIQEYLGLVISNENVMKRVKCCLVLYSPVGNTGKSQLQDVIISLLGGVSQILNASIQSMDGSRDKSRFTLGRLEGKRLIAVGDQSGATIHDSETFKTLTGGDVSKVECKGIQDKDIYFKGGMMICCNLLPYFEDDKGEQILERMLIVPTEHHIKKEERDPFISDKMKAELDGILAWLLEGLHRLRDNGYLFTHCEAVDRAREDYRTKLDSVYCFVKENFASTGNWSDSIPRSKFDSSYEMWASVQGYTHRVSKQNLPGRMQVLGFTLNRVHGIDSYRGIRFKTASETPTEPATQEEIDLNTATA